MSDSTNKYRERKSYTIEFKINVLKVLKTLGNICKASSALNVYRKNLRRWREEDKILKSRNKKKARTSSGGRKPFWPKLEELSKWVREERNARHVVSCRRVRERALILAKELEINEIKVCDNWIFKFSRRYGFCSRRPTNVGQEDNKSPEDKKETAERT